MPNASILVTAQDRYSETVKKMSTATRAFTKDAADLEKRLYALDKNKATLRLDVKEAKKALAEAEEQFRATRSEADGLKLELAQANYDNVVRNLKAVTKAAGDTEKAISRTENQAGSRKSFLNSAASAIAVSGIGSMGKDLALNIGSSWAGSFGGDEMGTMVSSILSSAATGAAMGSVLPGVGTVVGAAVGGLVGAGSGLLKNYEKQDDAFRAYVQEAAEGQISEQENSLSAGSTLAAQRETDLISFSTLFGSRQTAEDYLSGLVEMANSTPFLYDDLTAMSKTIATYGYGAGEILPILRSIGDTGAALGMGTSDMAMIATALGRMKSSDKTTLEYLNILNDRGIGAVGMLSDAYGVDQGTMYDMISKGEIQGTKAAEIILNAMTNSFAGSMEEQSKTFSGLSSTVEGLTQELDNAMGEGYNEGRMEGLAAQRDWLSGESGEAVMEANRAVGAWKADLENSKEEFIRKAVDEMMSTDEYQTAQAEGDAAEMGRLIMEAKVRGMNEYNASDGAQLALEAEKSLIAAIRADTSINDDYWDAGYERGKVFSKGLAAGIAGAGQVAIDEREIAWDGAVAASDRYGAGSYAVGLDYVPYDNFPALLHQGERVLTAAEARSERGGGDISITMNGVTIREEADVDRLAEALLQKLELAGMRG